MNTRELIAEWRVSLWFAMLSPLLGILVGMLGSEKISTRFVSVQVFGESKALLNAAPPKVRLEVVRDHTVLSVPVSSSYGFEEATGDVQLRLAPENSRTVEPNTVTLMITQPLAKETVSIRLLDALSGVEIVNTGSIDMTIAM
jgi:hypothetical protein